MIQEERSVFWGDDIVAHCENEDCMNMCPILNGYGDRFVWIYKYKSIVNGNKEREISYY
jgi:hypothetical protein